MSRKAVMMTATERSITKERLSLCARFMVGVLCLIGARAEAARVARVRISPMACEEIC